MNYPLNYTKNVLPYFIPSNFIFVCMRSVCIYNRRDIVHNMKLQNESLLSVVRHELSARIVSMALLICHLTKENYFLNIFQKTPYFLTYLLTYSMEQSPSLEANLACS